MTTHKWIRDNAGQWLRGFTCNIGFSTSTHAELWGIRAGLGIAWDMNVNSVIVESDSSLAIHLINTAVTVSHPLGALIDDCRGFLGRNWTCSICHTLREGNMCADYMANLSHDFPDFLKLFPSPPRGVLSLLAADAVGVVAVRL